MKNYNEITKKTEFVSPSIKIIDIACDDIITTSGGENDLIPTKRGGFYDYEE